MATIVGGFFITYERSPNFRHKYFIKDFFHCFNHRKKSEKKLLTFISIKSQGTIQMLKKKNPTSSAAIFVLSLRPSIQGAMYSAYNDVT